MADDAQLLEAWRLGERTAGEALFDRYFHHVQRFFSARRGRDVDDLIQQTFEACVQGKDRVREGSTFRSYLFGVAYNVLRTDRRQRRRTEWLAQVGVVPAVGPGPSTWTGARDEARWLREGLTRLPRRVREVLELHYFDDLTASDIAKVVGCPEGTVRSRLRRGRVLLRAVLGEQDPNAGIEIRGGTLICPEPRSEFEPA